MRLKPILEEDSLDSIDLNQNLREDIDSFSAQLKSFFAVGFQRTSQALFALIKPSSLVKKESSEQIPKDVFLSCPTGRWGGGML
jgi:hypothetical protein